MPSKPMLGYCIGTFLCLTLVQAMFFTDSTENEYPRIGKRAGPLSKYMYKKWLGLSDITDYDFDDLDYEQYLPKPSIRNLDRIHRQIDLYEVDTTPYTEKDRRSLSNNNNNTPWMYLTRQGDNF